MRDVLQKLVEAGEVTTDLKSRMMVAGFKSQSWDSDAASFSTSVTFNRIERGPDESFHLEISINFCLQRLDILLGADVGYGPEFFDSMPKDEQDVVAWLKRVMEKQPDIGGSLDARKAFQEDVAKHPKHFNRLIEKVEGLEKWLCASLEDLPEDACIF